MYSRVDGPGELAEPMKSELEADLYRHPSLLGDSRETFRKVFDIFSIGCMLLEIGLWSSMRSILERHANLAGRTLSWSTIDDSEASADLDDKKDEHFESAPDLMKLRHELLLSKLVNENEFGAGGTVSAIHERSAVLRSLEAATGKLYTSLVEDFLTAGETVKNSAVNEQEYALDLEIRGRDKVRAIAEAV